MPQSPLTWRSNSINGRGGSTNAAYFSLRHTEMGTLPSGRAATL